MIIRKSSNVTEKLRTIVTGRFVAARILGVLVRYCRLGRSAECQQVIVLRSLAAAGVVTRSARMIALGFRRAFVASTVTHLISPVGVMPHRLHRMTLMIERRVRRGVRRLPGFLGALDGALVDRGIENALAFLVAVLLVH